MSLSTMQLYHQFTPLLTILTLTQLNAQTITPWNDNEREYGRTNLSVVRAACNQAIGAGAARSVFIIQRKTAAIVFFSQ